MFGFKLLFKDLKQTFKLNFLVCYAEERLNGYRYLELIDKSATAKKATDEEQQNTYAFLDYFALRKLLNPINGLRFILLTLISILDFSLRILARALITLSWVIAFISTFPLRLISASLTLGIGRLIILPSMLCSWLFHASMNAVREIVEHVFSPINAFIRPLWNYFNEPGNVYLKVLVAAAYVGLTTGIITAIALTAGAALPLGLVIVGGIILSPPMIHASYKIARQALLALLNIVADTFSGHIGYSHRYSERVDNTRSTYLNIYEVFYANPENGFNGASEEKFKKADKIATQTIFNSRQEVRLEPSQGRSHWATAVSFFTGLEPENISVANDEAVQPTVGQSVR